jgi:hypothetical protein
MHKHERNQYFLNDMTAHFNKRNVMETIVGGDFNCILDPADSRGATKNMCFGLKQVVDLMHLKDCVAERASEKKFTFFRGSCASRLDRFYVSNGILSNMRSTETLPTAFSDHYGFIMKIEVHQRQLGIRHGYGYWKINPSLLLDDNIVARFGTKLGQIRQFRVYHENLVNWWTNAFKKNVKGFFKNEIIQFNRDVSGEKNFYYRALLQLSTQQNCGLNIEAEMSFAKSKLMDIERRKIDSLQHRFKASIGSKHTMRVNITSHYTCENYITRCVCSENLLLTFFFLAPFSSKILGG